MTNTATKTYLVGVIERAIAYYEVEAEDARTAAENWDEGEFRRDRDDEALDSEGPCNVREKQPDGTFLMLPPSRWEAEAPIGIKPEWIDAVRHARSWITTAREVLAQPERTAMVDHLLELGLGQIAAALAKAGEADLPPSDPAKKPYSILLLYPDFANDNGTETYYAFVEATDPIEAVAAAQRQAVAAQEGVDIEPDDFAPLLVTQGHCYSEALFNK